MPIRGCVAARKKNTKLEEDVDFLLPVKFRQIRFGDFRGEVENASQARVTQLIHLSHCAFPLYGSEGMKL